MKQTETTFVDQVFDILSSVPYLKRILKSLFIVTGGLMAFAFLFGQWKSNQQLLLVATLSIMGNAIVAYFFRLWDKREKKRANDEIM